MTAPDDKILEKLIKLMKMTTSSNDGEALTAVRMANGILARDGYAWETLLRGKITVIGDPFAGKDDAFTFPATARKPKGWQPAPAPRPAPPPPPRPQPQPAPKPAYYQAPPSRSRPYAPPPRPAQPQLGFRKDDHGYWCVGSDVTLPLDSVHLVIRKDGSTQNVRIKAFVSSKTVGRDTVHLYRFVDAGPGSIF